MSVEVNYSRSTEFSGPTKTEQAAGPASASSARHQKHRRNISFHASINTTTNTEQMSAVATLKGDMPQQVRSLVSTAVASPCNPPATATRWPLHAGCAGTAGHSRCLALSEHAQPRGGYLLLTPCNTVPPAITARRAVHLLQLPRVCEATNERCLPGEQGGARPAQGPGAGPEGIEGPAGSEGALCKATDLSTDSADKRNSVKPSSGSSTK